MQKSVRKRVLFSLLTTPFLVLSSFSGVEAYADGEASAALAPSSALPAPPEITVLDSSVELSSPRYQEIIQDFVRHTEDTVSAQKLTEQAEALGAIVSPIGPHIFPMGSPNIELLQLQNQPVGTTGYVLLQAIRDKETGVKIGNLASLQLKNERGALLAARQALVWKEDGRRSAAFLQANGEVAVRELPGAIRDRRGRRINIDIDAEDIGMAVGMLIGGASGSVAGPGVAIYGAGVGAYVGRGAVKRVRQYLRSLDD